MRSTINYVFFEWECFSRTFPFFTKDLTNLWQLWWQRQQSYINLLNIQWKILILEWLRHTYKWDAKKPTKVFQDSRLSFAISLKLELFGAWIGSNGQCYLYFIGCLQHQQIIFLNRFHRYWKIISQQTNYLLKLTMKGYKGCQENIFFSKRSALKIKTRVFHDKKLCLNMKHVSKSCHIFFLISTALT